MKHLDFAEALQTRAAECKTERFLLCGAGGEAEGQHMRGRAAAHAKHQSTRGRLQHRHEGDACEQPLKPTELRPNPPYLGMSRGSKSVGPAEANGVRVVQTEDLVLNYELHQKGYTRTWNHKRISCVFLH